MGRPRVGLGLAMWVGRGFAVVGLGLAEGRPWGGYGVAVG